MQYDKIIPRAVRNDLPYIQDAYIREFNRVEEQTGNALTAKTAADNFLTQLKFKLNKQSRVSKQHEMVLIEKSLDVRVLAHISEMSAMDCLPIETLNKIKQTDPHPFLVVYDVGGEGISDGKVDHKKERKLWSFHAIKKLAHNLKDGAVGIIHGHNNVGENTKRKLGRIVHAFTKTIKDSLHALAVAHVTDFSTIEKIKDGTFDVCSIEGNVLLARENENSMWFIKDVDELFNLAIGSSAVDKPGFTGAGVLATIQEMNKE